MFDFKKSENMKAFEQCIADIIGKEVAPMSLSIYHCWKLFNLKYSDIPSWKKSVIKQVEWLAYLSALAKDESKKELNQEAPLGTANGVYISLLFFRAVSQNEGVQTINAMSDYIEKFNRIGYQISQNSIIPTEIKHQAPSRSTTEMHAY